ncbi:MAG: hypothetical protein D6765_11155 [Bacteroidetes bacterium]|nr:MAG: hypothetical protein D6765_11155 [Bacteroidota bacterium]
MGGGGAPFLGFFFFRFGRFSVQILLKPRKLGTMRRQAFIFGGKYAREMRWRPLLEWFLAVFAVFMLLWVVDDYLATLLGAILGGVLLLVLLFAFVVELIERSKVPRLFFGILLVCLAGILFSALLYWVLFGGQLGWLQE